MYFRFMAAIYDFPFALTSDSIHNSPIGLLDLENVGVAVETSLLSCLQAKICDIAYVLPVNGGHL